MVTKLHSKQTWLPPSLVPGGTLKSTVKFADVSTSSLGSTSSGHRDIRSVASTSTQGLLPETLQLSRLSYTRQRSLDLPSACEYNNVCQSSKDDIVLGSWVKQNNPRRVLNYELYGFHCWVNVVVVALIIVIKMHAR